jgi:hypothetical protein
VVADNLTRQPNTYQPPLFQSRLLGDRHARWFAVDELDATRRAARVSAAGMQNIDVRILFDRKDESLAVRDINR